MFRRILGLIILLVSLILITILLGGVLYVGQAIDSLGEGLDSALALTSDTLDTVAKTLEQTKSTIAEANDALDTAAEATVNLSQTMNNMKPLMESTTKVVTEDVPGNIEAIQATLPNMIQVAGVIDSTLTRLSEFGIKKTIPIPFNPITLEFDLGIDYAPEEPFDASISALGDSMEGMPDELRSLQGNLEILTGDLELLAGNIETASGDIEAINEQVALYIPILDDYLRIVEQINDTLVQARGQMDAQLETLKTALVLLLVFLSLSQLAPIYLGWELLTEQRPDQTTEKEMAEDPSPSAAEKHSDDSQEDEPDIAQGETDSVPSDTLVEESSAVEQATVVEKTEGVDSETMMEDAQESENDTVVEVPSQVSDGEVEENQA